MKISLAFCLVLWITVTTQIDTSQIISKNGNKEIINENGTTNIEVTEPELLDVYVSNNELAFEICSMKCNGNFLVCYEGDPSNQNVVDECDSKCGFYVTTLGDEILVMEYVLPNRGAEKLDECDVVKMTYGEMLFRTGIFHSCKPKIENGMIKLDIRNATAECPIIIKNANLKRDVITTVLPSNNNPNSPSNSRPENSPTSKSPATNIFGILGWIFVLISICFLHQ